MQKLKEEMKFEIEELTVLRNPKGRSNNIDEIDSTKQ